MKLFENVAIDTLEEALPIILGEMVALKGGLPAPRGEISLEQRLSALDRFEMMIRIDDVAVQAGLSEICPQLDRWATVDPPSLVRRLRQEPGHFSLAALLTLSPQGLARMASELSLLRWMEVVRALNRVSPEQLTLLRQNHQMLEDYLLGISSSPPPLDLPWVLPVPAPSILRVVQGIKFRYSLLEEEGYRAAMARYIRFFC